MKLESLMLVRKETKRTLRLVRAVFATYGDNLPLSGSKETAALRRASMDPTRALAEMRKP